MARRALSQGAALARSRTRIAATLPNSPPSTMGVVKVARDHTNSAATGLRKMPRTGRASVLALKPPSATTTTNTQP